MIFNIPINSEGKLPKKAIQDLQNIFKSFAGKTITLSVEKYKKVRSIQQNRAYWGIVVKMISDKSGYDKDEIHDLLASHFVGTKEITVGDITKEVHQSTAELTTTDFMGYIEEIQRWAAEKLGLVIPDPNELEQNY